MQGSWSLEIFLWESVELITPIKNIRIRTKPGFFILMYSVCASCPKLQILERNREILPMRLLFDSALHQSHAVVLKRNVSLIGFSKNPYKKLRNWKFNSKVDMFYNWNKHLFLSKTIVNVKLNENSSPQTFICLVDFFI